MYYEKYEAISSENIRKSRKHACRRDDNINRLHYRMLIGNRFSQFKNSFVNRCLFKFRLLHSVLQSHVFSDFFAIIR